MELSAQTRSMTVRLLHFQMKFRIILVPAFISIIVKHQTRIICTNWPTPPQYNDGANHPFQMKSVEIKCDFICIMRANKEKAYILENKAVSLMKSVVFLQNSVFVLALKRRGLGSDQNKAVSLIELLVVVVSAAGCCSLKKKHQLVLSSSDVNTLIVSLPYID